MIAVQRPYRNKFQESIAAELTAHGMSFTFEEVTFEYQRPARSARYTPPFVLANGIVLQTKGRFVTADRQKHPQIRASHPSLDVRFVFSNSRARISKQSTTIYAAWCEKNAFQYAHRHVPASWIQEKCPSGASQRELMPPGARM
jgi:Phage endonuclease I